MLLRAWFSVKTFLVLDTEPNINKNIWTETSKTQLFLVFQTLSGPAALKCLLYFLNKLENWKDNLNIVECLLQNHFLKIVMNNISS